MPNYDCGSPECMTCEEAFRKPDLLPCPFCGEMPETVGSGEGRRGLMIQCFGKACPNPHVSYYDHASAIRAWNTRAAPETAAERDRLRSVNAELAEALELVEKHYGEDSDVFYVVRAALQHAKENGDG